MVFYWYFIEISTGFPMQIHWYFIEISIEFQLDFDWKFIVISTGCPLDFHCNFNTVSTGLQMFFRFILHWNFQLNFQLDFRMMSIRIIEISTGLPMDFNWYFIEISTGFPMGIHWNFFEISIELQLDFQCASTWPASSQKFPRTSRTKLTKKKPVYVSGPAMAKHQKQLWSDPLWDCHSLPPSPPPPLSSPWTPPATPPRWELLRRTCGWATATSLLQHTSQPKVSQMMKERRAEQAPEETHIFYTPAILPPRAGRCKTWTHPQASHPQGRRGEGLSLARLRKCSKLANRHTSSWKGTCRQTVQCHCSRPPWQRAKCGDLQGLAPEMAPRSSRAKLQPTAVGCPRRQPKVSTCGHDSWNFCGRTSPFSRFGW